MRIPRSTRTSLVLAVLAACTASPARAVWSPDSVLALGGAGTNGVLRAGVLPGAAGDLYVVWRWASNTPATSAARVTRDGGVLFGERGLGGTGVPAVALDGGGGLTEAWSQNDLPYGKDISVDRLAPDGSAAPSFWAAQKSLDDQFPSVATDPADGAYLSWNDGQHLYLQRVTANGAIAAGWPVLGRRLASPPAGLPPTNPALLPDGAGGAYVLYQSDLARVLRVRPDTTLAPGWPAGGLALESVASTWNATYGLPDFALVPGASGHTYAVWTEGNGTFTTDRRIMVQSFTASGTLDWLELQLLPITAGVGSVRALSDGQGGLLVSWLQAGAFRVAHVLADETVAAPPFTAIASTSHPGVVEPSRNGGFIVFSADASGVIATWYLSNGALDAGVPSNPRLVHPHTPDHLPRPEAALTDGDGGAYLVLQEEVLTFSHPVLMRHVFRTGVLAVDPGPRPSSLALSVSPNPARTQIAVEYIASGAAPGRLDLLDVSGRLLASRALAGGSGPRRERLELPAGAPPGLYLVRVSQGPEASVRRFAIVR